MLQIVCPPFPLCPQQPASQRAEAMYRQCLAVNSEHSYALYNLAVLKEETTKDGDYSEVKATVVVNRDLSCLTMIQLVTSRPSDY